jgi:hypothetical protein
MKELQWRQLAIILAEGERRLPSSSSRGLRVAWRDEGAPTVSGSGRSSSSKSSAAAWPSCGSMRGRDRDAPRARAPSSMPLWRRRSRNGASAKAVARPSKAMARAAEAPSKAHLPNAGKHGRERDGSRKDHKRHREIAE